MKITKILLSIFLTFVIILLTTYQSGAIDVPKLTFTFPTVSEYVDLPVAPYYKFICGTAGAEIYEPIWEEEKNEKETVTSTEVTSVVVEPEHSTCATPNSDEIDRDFLAKLLYAEAGSMTFEGQVWVCSAILNLCEYKDVSLWSAGHNRSIFSVAYHVDKVVPNDTTHEVIDYVLSGNRIADVCYFRKHHYHRFGTPVTNIDNVYFSKP